MPHLLTRCTLPACRYGWRVFFWICTGLQVLVLILLLVAFPETQFDRSTANQPSVTIGMRSTDRKSSEEDASEQAYQQRLKQEVNHIETGSQNLGATEDAQQVAPVGMGRPTAQNWKLWQPVARNWKASLFEDLVSPWMKFFNPIIFWAGLMVAGPANLLLLW